jgi:hypothetical protein
MSEPVRVLVISGSMGVGKTTVLAEASDLLTERAIVHAAIDVDALGLACLPAGAPDDLSQRNLGCVWGNFAGAGMNRLLLAMAVEDRAALDLIRAAIGPCEMIVCRLTASAEIRRDRLATREMGIFRAQYLRRGEELEAILDASAVEAFQIPTDGRSVTDIGRDLLTRAAWIDRSG